MSASKLIVLMAFDESADGELVPAFEPKQVETEDRAVREARALSNRHVDARPHWQCYSHSVQPIEGKRHLLESAAL